MRLKIYATVDIVNCDSHNNHCQLTEKWNKRFVVLITQHEQWWCHFPFHNKFFCHSLSCLLMFSCFCCCSSLEIKTTIIHNHVQELLSSSSLMNTLLLCFSPDNFCCLKRLKRINKPSSLDNERKKNGNILRTRKRKNFQIICEMKTFWPLMNVFSDCGRRKKKVSKYSRRREILWFRKDVSHFCRRVFSLKWVLKS